jgi:hypothetical protein
MTPAGVAAIGNTSAVITNQTRGILPVSVTTLAVNLPEEGKVEMKLIS